MGLTDKQARFVEEYLIDLNATRAAKAAGYSESTARQIGQENLTKPDVQDAIQAAIKARSERTQIDQDWVITRLAAIADADIKRVLKWDAAGVHLTDSDELDWKDTYTVTEVILNETIKETEDGKELIMKREKKLKQADKKPALELLGRHLGMFNDKLKLQGDPEKPLNINLDLSSASHEEIMAFIRNKTHGE